MRACFFSLLLGYSLILAGQGDAFTFTSSTEPATNKNFFRLGDKVLTLVRHGDNTEKPYVLLSLHHNESTAIRAARQFVNEKGGVFYELLNNEQRLVAFELMERKVRFDPNRIFTSRGREDNLKLYKSWHKVVQEQVLYFSRFILNELPEDKVIIAVHNNTDGHYNITDYKKGGKLARDAREVFINPEMDADNFYLTTSQDFYDQLKELNFNVILQANKAKDDGSLSVYCGKTNKPYINIETQEGQLEEQLMMLTVAEKILK